MRLILALNMKAYETAFGQAAVELAREASRLSSRLSSLRVILAAPALTALKLSQIHGDVFLQHVDAVDPGAYTGFLPIEALKIEGVRGTIVNHSEHKLTYREVQRILEKARQLGVETLACADTPEESAAIALLEPTMIAVEPPELIGTGVAVSRARPETITRAVQAVKKTSPQLPVLAGAGISTPEDAIKAIELGASGILVASAIMKNKNPAEKLREFAEAMATI
ncbi:MAG: triose-phosphate isomerase [Acidilobaceae archaeon]